MYNSKSTKTDVALMTASNAKAKAEKNGLPTEPRIKKARLKRALAGSLMQLARNFKTYDRDKSGGLGPEEFRSALKSMQLPCTDVETCAMVFEEFDFDDSGAITYSEVMRYTLLEIISNSAGRLNNIFRLWDADCSGTINEEEFRNALRSLGSEIPRKDMTQLFNELDEDRSGELDYSELARKLMYPKAAKQISMDLAAKAASKLGTAAGSGLAAGGGLAAARAYARLKRGRVTRPQTSRPRLASSSRPPSPSPSLERALDLAAMRADPRELVAAYREGMAQSAQQQPSPRLVEADRRRLIIEELAVERARTHQQADAVCRAMAWPHYRREVSRAEDSSDTPETRRHGTCLLRLTSGEYE